MVPCTVTEITRHERARPRLLPAIGTAERAEDYAHMSVAPGNEPKPTSEPERALL